MEYIPFPIRMTVIKGLPSQFEAKSRFEGVLFPTFTGSAPPPRPLSGQLWPRGK